jgi:capsular exopolysaccharide synthesis family protein
MERIVSYENPKSIISEEYKKIRTSIQYSNLDKKIKTILVTSTTKNEGKTTTVTNLAVNFAAIDKKKVLIIDCDLRNPSAHKEFGISNLSGLTDLLVEEENIINYLKPTKLENLHVITAGSIPPNPAEILASNKMKALIEKLKGEYDYIFIDTPPIGMVTDAGILASFIDGTILVVKSDGVDTNQLENTKKKLDSVNANLIGAVLNAYKIKKDDYYYYSYYGSK